MSKGHEHEHRAGLRGILHRLLVPHSHDAADSIDHALESNERGIQAIKVSLLVLLLTALVQGVVVLFSGSVALLADTVHNVSDGMTAIPLWIAFVLGRRAATRRYTFGFGRAEDIAGLFIVLVVAASAAVAAWQSIDRLINPQPLTNLGWVLAAGLVGFAGNEIVAVYRTRVGREIGSAALVADGVHARADGLTSLAVVFGALGVMLGFPLADPIVGLVISAAIVVLLVATIKPIGRRLMDGIEPQYVGRAETAIRSTEGVLGMNGLRLRWVGHRLQGSASVEVADMALSDARELAARVHSALERELPHLEHFDVVMSNRTHPLGEPRTGGTR